MLEARDYELSHFLYHLHQMSYPGLLILFHKYSLKIYVLVQGELRFLIFFHLDNK